jgi:hypothetical protein
MLFAIQKMPYSLHSLLKGFWVVAWGKMAAVHLQMALVEYHSILICGDLFF